MRPQSRLTTGQPRRTVGHEEEIVVGDLGDVDSCDIVCANFSEPDEGTAMEA
jgi:nucleoside 2-deoxyribosyltransferase